MNHGMPADEVATGGTESLVDLVDIDLPVTQPIDISTLLITGSQESST